MPAKRNAAPFAAVTVDRTAGLPEVSASGPCDYRRIPPPGSSFPKEQGIEQAFIEKLIEQAVARSSFYSEKLNYYADLATAKEYLTKTHENYLPSAAVNESSDDKDKPVKKAKAKRAPSKSKPE